MKKLFTLLLLIASVAKAQLIEVSATKKTYTYAVYLPKNYDASKPYPYIVFLHGIGERGLNMSLDAAVHTHGPIAEISRGLKAPDAIIIEPQYYSSPWNARMLKNTLDSIGKIYLLDLNRFYLTGLSMGGGGAVNFLDSFPTLVKAAFSASPAGGFKTAAAPQIIADSFTSFGEYICIPDPVVGYANAFNNIYKIWKNDGWKQTNIVSTKPPGAATAFLDKKTKAYKWVPGQQYPDSTVYPHYIIAYNDGGHGAWNRIYADANFYTWLLSLIK